MPAVLPAAAAHSPPTRAFAPTAPSFHSSKTMMLAAPPQHIKDESGVASKQVGGEGGGQRSRGRRGGGGAAPGAAGPPCRDRQRRRPHAGGQLGQGDCLYSFVTRVLQQKRCAAAGCLLSAARQPCIPRMT
jgi:hypothetical protein